MTDSPQAPNDTAPVRGERRARRDESRERGIGHYIGLGASVGLLALVVALAAILIVVPKLAGATPLTILTSSMEPGLPPGTLIVVEPVDPDELVIGDVVTYQIRSGDPTVITHRIIGITAVTDGTRTFQLQGDNNSDPDPEAVLEEQVQGRVWYSVPYVGFVNSVVNGENRAVIIPVVAIALLGYAAATILLGIRSSIVAKRARSTE
ncbi:signal peptidase I [Marisediminicola sp. LYQ134]|uniref:signal peptidase I n=1 Tax=Marisediminicola sp. LYQ134 TaxID=3391061 RepID=UPI003983736F